jgi:hypothetical protein
MLMSACQYLLACVEQCPDATLPQLSMKLWAAYRVEVSESTISRELHRHGFTRKTVRVLLAKDMTFVLFSWLFRCLVLPLSGARLFATHIKHLWAPTITPLSWFSSTSRDATDIRRSGGRVGRVSVIGLDGESA